MAKVWVIGAHVGRALGLLSILFLSAILPWRAAICAAANPGAPTPLAICKADASTGHSLLIVSPDTPKPEPMDCQICLGLAGLQFAIATVALPGPALAHFAYVLRFPQDLHVDGQFGLLRSSRAPPLAV